jgi:4'-phosphopantetheinyl transferase
MLKHPFMLRLVSTRQYNRACFDRRIAEGTVPKVPSDLTSKKWQVEDHLAAPAGNEAHLWKIELANSRRLIETCISFLSADEINRANRFQHVQAREQFIIGRGWLRRLLATATGMEPALIPLAVSRYGKPEAPGTGVSINVAHSGGTILIALCRGGRVGIDVEDISSTADFLEVARYSFTQAEFLYLASIDDADQRRRAFYRCWTQKEAVLKADGRGLSVSMTSFEIPLPLASTATVHIGESPDAAASHFYVADLPLSESFAGAVALDSSDRQIKLLTPPSERF